MCFLTWPLWRLSDPLTPFFSSSHHSKFHFPSITTPLPSRLRPRLVGPQTWNDGSCAARAHTPFREAPSFKARGKGVESLRLRCLQGTPVERMKHFPGCSGGVGLGQEWVGSYGSDSLGWAEEGQVGDGIWWPLSCWMNYLFMRTSQVQAP